jgi:hypothetical protein
LACKPWLRADFHLSLSLFRAANQVLEVAPARCRVAGFGHSPLALALALAFALGGSAQLRQALRQRPGVRLSCPGLM